MIKDLKGKQYEREADRSDKIINFKSRSYIIRGNTSSHKKKIRKCLEHG